MGLEIDTLVVFTTNRSRFIIDDQIEAIDWGCTGTHFTVVTDCTGNFVSDEIVIEEGGHAIIPTQVANEKHLSGFKNNEGIRWALGHEVDFKQVLCMDDDALIIGQGIDEWALAHMSRTAIDLLGVQDRVNYQPRFVEAKTLMEAWVREARNVDWIHDISPDTVFYAINFISREFAQTLYDRRLLVPRSCDSWPLWPDQWISWMCQILGFTWVCWGHMDYPRAPIYANHRGYMKGGPRPQILSPDFKIYHPVRYVPMVDEDTIRRDYRRLRQGEPVELAPAWPGGAPLG